MKKGAPPPVKKDKYVEAFLESMDAERNLAARTVAPRRSSTSVTLQLACVPNGEHVDPFLTGADLYGHIHVDRGSVHCAPRLTDIYVRYEASLCCGTIAIRPTGYHCATAEGKTACMVFNRSEQTSTRSLAEGAPLPADLDWKLPTAPIEKLMASVWFAHDTWSEIVDNTCWRPATPSKFKLQAPFAGRYIGCGESTKATKWLRFHSENENHEHAIQVPRIAELMIAPKEEVRCGDYFAAISLPDEPEINRSKHDRNRYHQLVEKREQRIARRSWSVSAAYMRYAMQLPLEDGVVVPLGSDSILPAMLVHSPSTLREADGDGKLIIPPGHGPYVGDCSELLRLAGLGRILWGIDNTSTSVFATQVTIGRHRSERAGMSLEAFDPPWQRR